MLITRKKNVSFSASSSHFFQLICFHCTCHREQPTLSIKLFSKWHWPQHNKRSLNERMQLNGNVLARVCVCECFHCLLFVLQCYFCFLGALSLSRSLMDFPWRACLCGLRQRQRSSSALSFLLLFSLLPLHRFRFILLVASRFRISSCSVFIWCWEIIAWRDEKWEGEREREAKQWRTEKKWTTAVAGVSTRQMLFEQCARRAALCWENCVADEEQPSATHSKGIEEEKKIYWWKFQMMESGASVCGSASVFAE